MRKNNLFSASVLLIAILVLLLGISLIPVVSAQFLSAEDIREAIKQADANPSYTEQKPQKILPSGKGIKTAEGYNIDLSAHTLSDPHSGIVYDYRTGSVVEDRSDGANAYTPEERWDSIYSDIEVFLPYGTEESTIYQTPEGIIVNEALQVAQDPKLGTWYDLGVQGRVIKEGTTLAASLPGQKTDNWQKIVDAVSSYQENKGDTSQTSENTQADTGQTLEELITQAEPEEQSTGGSAEVESTKEGVPESSEVPVIEEGKIESGPVKQDTDLTPGQQLSSALGLGTNPESEFESSGMKSEGSPPQQKQYQNVPGTDEIYLPSIGCYFGMGSGKSSCDPGIVLTKEQEDAVWIQIFNDLLEGTVPGYENSITPEQKEQLRQLGIQDITQQIEEQAQSGATETTGTADSSVPVVNQQKKGSFTIDTKENMVYDTTTGCGYDLTMQVVSCPEGTSFSSEYLQERWDTIKQDVYKEMNAQKTANAPAQITTKDGYVVDPGNTAIYDPESGCWFYPETGGTNCPDDLSLTDAQMKEKWKRIREIAAQYFKPTPEVTQTPVVSPELLEIMNRIAMNNLALSGGEGGGGGGLDDII